MKLAPIRSGFHGPRTTARPMQPNASHLNAAPSQQLQELLITATPPRSRSTEVVAHRTFVAGPGRVETACSDLGFGCRWSQHGMRPGLTAAQPDRGPA